MVDQVTEQLSEMKTTRAERVRFILLVIGFIALAMISQQQEKISEQNSSVNSTKVNLQDPAVVCAHK